MKITEKEQILPKLYSALNQFTKIPISQEKPAKSLQDLLFDVKEIILQLKFPKVGNDFAFQKTFCQAMRFTCFRGTTWEFRNSRLQDILRLRRFYFPEFKLLL